MNLKVIALHDLTDWLPLERMRVWMSGSFESNTAIASNPLFFQTGRDAASERSKQCSTRPDSVLWRGKGGSPDGQAVWDSQILSAKMNAEQASLRVGSFSPDIHIE